MRHQGLDTRGYPVPICLGIVIQDAQHLAVRRTETGIDVAREAEIAR